MVPTKRVILMLVGVVAVVLPSHSIQQYEVIESEEPVPNSRWNNDSMTSHEESGVMCVVKAVMHHDLSDTSGNVPVVVLVLMPMKTSEDT
jgi:hypothetical protein